MIEGAEEPHRPGRHDGVEVVEFREDPWAPLIKEGVDGLLDDADGVVRPAVQVGADLGKDVLRHIVEGVAREHVCRVTCQHNMRVVPSTIMQVPQSSASWETRMHAHHLPSQQPGELSATGDCSCTRSASCPLSSFAACPTTSSDVKCRTKSSAECAQQIGLGGRRGLQSAHLARVLTHWVAAQSIACLLLINNLEGNIASTLPRYEQHQVIGFLLPSLGSKLRGGHCTS